MEEALTSIVYKLNGLGYKEDDYRNRLKSNQYLNLQHFCKKSKESAWEAFVSYNPNNQTLVLNYYEIYESAEKYVKSVIKISNDLDAQTACELLESNTDTLWAYSDSVKPKVADLTRRLTQMGFTNSETQNNITKWVYKDEKQSYSILVENGVALSIYFFTHQENSKSFPLIIARDIRGSKTYDAVMSFIRRKTL